MKKNILLLYFLINSSLYANEINEIKKQYYLDDELYLQFIDIGKSICMDKILFTQKIFNNKYKNYLFDKHYKTLAGLNSKFRKYYKWSDMKLILDAFYEKNIHIVISKYKEKDEYFKLEYHSPLFICNDLFTKNNELKETYYKFINEYNLLNPK